MSSLNFYLGHPGVSLHSFRHRLDRLVHPSFFHKSRGHGRRAGHRLQRPIPIRLAREHPNNKTQVTTHVNPVSHVRLALVYPRTEQCVDSPARKLRIGLLNIRSVNKKTENVPDLFTDYRLNVLALVETWYEDGDCFAVKRLMKWDTMYSKWHVLFRTGLRLTMPPLPIMEAVMTFLPEKINNSFLT